MRKMKGEAARKEKGKTRSENPSFNSIVSYVQKQKMV